MFELSGVVVGAGVVVVVVVDDDDDDEAVHLLFRGLAFVAGCVNRYSLSQCVPHLEVLSTHTYSHTRTHSNMCGT